MSDNFEMVIGLEVHVQLNTVSKAFCGDENRFGVDPNSLVSAISLAHPGTLPRLNEAQILKAIRLGLSLGGRINSTSTFDRKNYFYPDLPKGYQITQDRVPIVVGGAMDIKDRSLRLHHIHMEEDAGKLIHDLDDTFSLVDLNRAGVPLLEIVTEPDFRTASEVEIFLERLRQLVRWLDVSDGNMEEGSMRCDVNLSLRPFGQEAYGNRCEIKNLNSMRFAKQAIAYERKRQAGILNAGGTIQQQTLNFDPESGITTPLRDKEEAHDYRYFPDPDLPPMVISNTKIDEIKSQMPELPLALKERWNREYKIVEKDADVLIQSKERALKCQEWLIDSKDPKLLSQFLVNKIIPYAKESKKELTELTLSSEKLNEFLELILSEQVASSKAYQVLFPKWVENPDQDIQLLAKKLGVIHDNNMDAMTTVINELIANHPKELEAYRGGKEQLLGFFMGQLMRMEGVKANPKLAKDLMIKVLNS